MDESHNSLGYANVSLNSKENSKKTNITINISQNLLRKNKSLNFTFCKTNKIKNMHTIFFLENFSQKIKTHNISNQ
jgi:hypothetical protein